MFCVESELIALNIICMIRILCVPKLSERSLPQINRNKIYTTEQQKKNNSNYDDGLIIIIKMVQHGIN